MTHAHEEGTDTRLGYPSPMEAHALGWWGEASRGVRVLRGGLALDTLHLLAGNVNRASELVGL
jgi:hypothetical protein